MRRSGSSVMPAGSNRMLVYLRDVGGQRHAVLEPEADRDGEGVHDPGQGRALLGDLHEDLARPAVLVLADRHVALAVGHPEREGARAAPARQALADRAHDHRRGSTAGARARAASSSAMLAATARSRASASDPAGVVAALGGVASFLVVESGWADLAVVAVDGDGLEPEPPGVDVQLLDVLDRHLLGHVDRLGDGAAR